MFKKLRDKIAEEVKQSPLKFQTSVQQITQAVSLPASLSVSDSSNDISLVEDEEENTEERKHKCLDEVASTSEFDSSFTTVDLRCPPTPKTRRASSSSSITSELFPIYEVTPCRYNLQSDLESCSEFDDGSSIHQYNNVSKENLYEKYRNILQKYHKYRGRFVDAQKYCQELQRELNKAKNVLTETQDKAIRRIAELKEQSTLDQKAKAHLEDVLRNELEERDHIINTLNTKIELLKSGKDCDNIGPINIPKNISKSGISKQNTSVEVENLKEKIKNFEVLLNKAKDAITAKNSRIEELQVKAELDKNELKLLKDRISELQDKIDTMKRKEEESLLSLAENKLNVHQELEAKESQIKNLESKIVELVKEIKRLRNTKEKHDAPIDVSSNSKPDELKALKEELQQLKIARNNDLTSLAEKDRLLHEFKTTVDASNHELLKLKNEIKAASLFTNTEDTKVADSDSNLKQSESTIKKLESLLFKKENELNELRTTETEKDKEISVLNDVKIQLEEKIADLEQKLSIAKTEAINNASVADYLKDQVTVLNESIQKTNGILNEKETQLAQKNDLVNRLETELVALKADLTASIAKCRSREETEIHLKADKIVLEETVKTLRNELDQKEMHNAKNCVTEYEKMLAEKENLVSSKMEMEKRLRESEAEVTRLRMELQGIQKSEQEILLQTTSLLQEIDDLKCKERKYVEQIEKLNTNMITSQNSPDESKQRSDEIESVQRENESLKMSLKQLEAEMAKIQKSNETLSDERTELKIQIEKQQKLHDTENLKYEDLHNQFLILEEKFSQLNEQCSELQRTNCMLTEERTILEERISRMLKSHEENVDILERFKKLEAEQNKWEQNEARLIEFMKQNETLIKENNAYKLECQNCLVEIIELENLIKQSLDQLEKKYFLKIKTELSTKHAIELTQIRAERDRVQHENEILKNDCHNHKKKMNDINEENVRLQEEISALTMNLEQIEKNLIDERNSKIYAEETVEKLSCELEKLQILCQQLQNDNECYVKTYDEVHSFVQEIEPFLKRCLQYEHLLADLRNTNITLTSENEQTVATLTNLRKEMDYLISENKLLNDEVSTLSIALKNSNSALVENPITDINVLCTIKNRITNLKNEYIQFKTDLMSNMNVLRQFYVDCGTQLKNSGIKIIENNLTVFSQLEDRLSNLEPQYEILKKEKILWEKEKEQLQTKLRQLSSTLETIKPENGDVDRRIQVIEDTYTSKIKHMIAEFEKQLAEKDNECDELRNKLLLRHDQDNAASIQETKEIVENFKEELKSNQDAYEQLLEKFRQDTDKWNTEKLELKNEHMRELKANDKNWRLCLDKKILEMEEKHKEEINELTNEWCADRKLNGSTLAENNAQNQILEDFAKHTENHEALKTQVQVLSNELNSCKKTQWKDIDLELYNTYDDSEHSKLSIEDCTEMEYLRNILFEYMMGHQPLVLAKVLAAVVKFDNNQTKQILEREEQKLSLFGHLGLT